ncbi:uncharacterized protein LAESUDRAFT_677694 [Laetiporus sulphureus 93-53]|uniref:TFIIS N-terminal domain-containing protein n=1 Tax=Laetiporus sulphureus 93-53 TaxID=1314785 RepID=A0A165EUC5_9APHY|nr:uncharacterized protein LAESUDRAFT_677694 [Laetiporus sulphureus 93-53]KZT07780.1 hypothetical protein LAESUDRAFT_677694 [Laetiporus sulphureus 93-53]
MDQLDLERQIFGRDSDDELSLSEDEEVPQRRIRRESPGARAEEVESSADSGDEYVQEKRVAKEKIHRKTRRATAEDGEQRPKQRKRKRRQREEVDLSQLPPEQANKLKLDMQIEAILKPKRTSRPKRKKKDDEDVLDRYADEEVARLREAMLAAVLDDEQANKEKLPATAKLRLLPQVVEVLRKNSLSQSILDNNLLEGVGKWLGPLPDKSLPALDIQKEFFPILKNAEYIDTNALKDSKLGRVIMFYTKSKRVSPDIARLANELVATWSRPIIKRSASYRDRIIPTAPGGEGETVVRSGERLNAILARAKENEKNRVRKNAVMIPQRELGSYTVAPRTNSGITRSNVSVDVDIERRKKNAERLRTLTRKISTKS